MASAPVQLICANCGGQVRGVEAKTAGWRYWSDRVGELLPFCPECAYREFRPDAPASNDIRTSRATDDDRPSA